MYRLALVGALVIAAVVVPSAFGAQAPAGHDLTATATATATPAVVVNATPVEHAAPFSLEANEPQCRMSATQQIVPVPEAICGGVNQGCCPGNECAGNLVCIGGKCRGSN